MEGRDMNRKPHGSVKPVYSRADLTTVIIYYDHHSYSSDKLDIIYILYSKHIITIVPTVKWNLEGIYIQ